MLVMGVQKHPCDEELSRLCDEVSERIVMTCTVIPSTFYGAVHEPPLDCLLPSCHL